jgi:hypothetical protein
VTAATCRSCGADIDWAISDATGKLMPVNHQPDPAGNVAVRRDEDGTLRCRSAPAGAPLSAGERRGTSHFATCEQAADWRKT